VVDHLVGISEIAQMLGVSRQRAVQLVGGYDDFPAPNATLAARRIWERNQVEAWMAKHPERKPGRPTRKSRPGDGTTGK
jgi:predicted DNA-binding transcriptional regulator AlpA